MGQHMPDIDFASVEMNRCYQPAFISAYIEHNQIINFICGWECPPQRHKTGKITLSDDSEPSP
jgi:hypothetical protein